jgi:hypothetical protein
MQRILRLDQFKSNAISLDENIDISGILGKVIPSLGTGFIKTLKQKLAAVLMEKIGVKENSKFSIIIQELVDSIEFKEMPGLITGENANAEFLAPRLAQAVQEYIQRKGMDSLIEPFGLEPNGWMYSTIRESLQGELGKEKLTAFFMSAFSDEPIGAKTISSLSDKEKEAFKGEFLQKASKAYPTSASARNITSDKKENGGGGVLDTLSGIWDGFVAGAKK